jgi:hypothetical protein
MTHPITPPPELVQQWYDQAKQDPCGPINWVATRAAQWGADQELEACCTELDEINCQKYWSERLRAARLPKPPSLKEQALALLDPSNTYGSITQEDEYRIGVTKAEIIRRALEALPND